MIARAFVLWFVFAASLAPASAHEVVVYQQVDVTLTPDDTRLVVGLHVPVAVAGGAQLPLPVLAADIARNLDLRQDEEAVPAPVITVRPNADGISFDVALAYAIRGDGTPVSARLNAFDATAGPVRTTARYHPASGAAQIIEVTGPPSRVTFDLPAAAVLARFAGRGARALLDEGDPLLLLACLLLMRRSARSAAALFAVLAGGQALALLIAAARPPIDATWLTAAAMIGASAVVIAALQNIARARARWVIAVTTVFAICSGLSFATRLSASVPLAGAHGQIAIAAFALVVLLGELWLGALAWAFRAWLDERGVPELVLSIGGSALVAHDALHRVLDRGHLLAQDGAFGGERVLVWLTLGWAGAVLLAAASRAWAGRTEDAS